MSDVCHVVSMSGGKDSTATALLALETQPRDSLRFVFADTGNEHELTIEYLSYLEQALNIEIVRLRRDFTPEWEHRREWLMSDAPRKGNARWPARSEVEIARILAVFDKGPTGNYRGQSSFFPSPNDSRGTLMGRGIDDVIAWAQTSRGGRQLDLLKLSRPELCSSAYGLCE